MYAAPEGGREGGREEVWEGWREGRERERGVGRVSALALERERERDRKSARESE